MDESPRIPGGRRRTDIFRRLWSRYQEDIGAEAIECPFCRTLMQFQQQSTGGSKDGEVFTIIWQCPDCRTQMAEAHTFRPITPGPPFGPIPGPMPDENQTIAPETEPE